MRSLRDLCETEANASTRPVERRDAQGHPLWEIRFKAQPGHMAWDVRRESLDGKYYSYVVTLSPRHGYSIIDSERITRIDKAERGTQADLVIHDRHQVLEFQEPAPGLFLPRRIRVTRIRSDTTDNPQYLGEIVIHDVQVNGPVTDAELAFRFPRGIGLFDVGKKVHYIWGDGAPSQTLTTDEYNALRKQEMLKLQGQVVE